jgi:hypothetical protein
MDFSSTLARVKLLGVLLGVLLMVVGCCVTGGDDRAGRPEKRAPPILIA